MLKQVKYFKGLFVALFHQGLPPFCGEYGKMISQFQYQVLLVKVGLDHNKFEGMNKSLIGKTIIDELAVDFELVDSFRTTVAQLPPISYVDHVELRVLDKEMEKIEMPSRDQWKTIEKFGEMKYRLLQ